MASYRCTYDVDVRIPRVDPSRNRTTRPLTVTPTRGSHTRHSTLHTAHTHTIYFVPHGPRERELGGAATKTTYKRRPRARTPVVQQEERHTKHSSTAASRAAGHATRSSAACRVGSHRPHRHRWQVARVKALERLFLLTQQSTCARAQAGCVCCALSCFYDTQYESVRSSVPPHRGRVSQSSSTSLTSDSVNTSIF